MNDEIEAKKAKLRELREQRRRREEAANGSTPQTRAKSSPFTPPHHILSHLVSPTPQPRDDASRPPLARPDPPSIPKSALSTTVACIYELPASKRYSKASQTPDERLKRLLTPHPETVASAPLSPEPETKEPEDQQQEEIPEFSISDEVSEDMLQFVRKAWRVMARSADNHPEPLIDYAAKNANKLPQKQGINKLLSLKGTECVISIDWSPHYDSLVAVAYSGGMQGVHGPGIQIYSLEAPSAPEYTLKAATDILSVRFSPSFPWRIYGSGYNGQILVWDLRSGRTDILPSLKSTVDGSGHLFPVFSLEICGSLNHDVLVSCSTDGTVCTWPSDMLSKPTHKLQLTDPTTASSLSTALAVTVLKLHPRDNTSFLTGTLDGNIFSGHRVDSVGARAGLDTKPYSGHSAPVTSIVVHNSAEFFLSTSLDWSICIWSFDTWSPLLSIELEDVVTDAAWSPHHQGVFAVTCRNKLHLFNLSESTDLPVSTFEAQNLLNRVVWSPYDAHKLQVLAGDAQGNLLVFSVSPEIVEDTTELASLMSSL